MKCPLCGKHSVFRAPYGSETCSCSKGKLMEEIERLKKELSELRDFVSKTSLGYLIGDDK